MEEGRAGVKFSFKALKAGMRQFPVETLWSLISWSTCGSWFPTWPGFHWTLKAGQCVSAGCPSEQVTASWNSSVTLAGGWVPQALLPGLWACSTRILGWTGAWTCLSVDTHSFDCSLSEGWVKLSNVPLYYLPSKREGLWLYSNVSSQLASHFQYWEVFNAYEWEWGLCY